jgi:hypothetical protein
MDIDVFAAQGARKRLSRTENLLRNGRLESDAHGETTG